MIDTANLMLSRVDFQQRSRSLAETLLLARKAAPLVGITRLAEITHVDRIGVPVYQAVRPASLSLSVSQGKGLTRQGAMISALLESIETAVAEALSSPPDCRPLASLDDNSKALWALAPRTTRSLALWPDLPRRWCSGHDLMSGRAALLPFDLVSMDFTVTPSPDVFATSVGLASGNDRDEALAGAVAEVLEHDMTAAWRDLAPRARRAVALDPDSVDSPPAQALFRRLAGQGFHLLLWDVGRDHGVPGFQCAITDSRDSATSLPPALGNGCHVDCEVALLRAVLEAIQARATLIAGARDDLTEAQFGDGQLKTVELILSTLSIGPPPLSWSSIPPSVSRGSRADTDILLAAIARRTSLAVVGTELPVPLPGLAVARVLAPGLGDEEREIRPQPPRLPNTGGAFARPRGAAQPDPRRLPIVFAGPSLAMPVPPGIMLRPPAVAGDLTALLAAPPPAIGLVDGCFETAPSVWHKEIMDLAAIGVHVVGGASLGALRAAELQGFGMIGVGHVFAVYRDGIVNRDDAVFVSHAPGALAHRAITVALVDAEFAIRVTPMCDAERRDLLRIVRTMPFRQRDWPACLAMFEHRTGRPAPATAATLSAIPSVKASDARLVIDTVLCLATQPPGDPVPPPPLTCFHADLLRRRTPALPADRR